MIPVTDDTKAYKIRALAIDLLIRIVAAGLAKFRSLYLLTSLADFLFDGQLDRQPVTVPPGYVRRVVSAKTARLDYNVLKNLVQRVPEMNIAIGIRWTIVQHVLGTPASDLAHALVQVHVLPGLQQLRFTVGQVGFHRETGAWQV